MRNKYYNKKTCIDGIEFDSRKEARRYQELKLMERAGVIKDLKMQVKFELIPAQYETVETGEYYKIGAKKGQPKTKDICIEESITYYADFVYTEGKNKVLEDTKGIKTEVYKIKKKLMLWIHGIRIKEV